MQLLKKNNENKEKTDRAIKCLKKGKKILVDKFFSQHYYLYGQESFSSRDSPLFIKWKRVPEAIKIISELLNEELIPSKTQNTETEAAIQSIMEFMKEPSVSPDSAIENQISEDQEVNLNQETEIKESTTTDLIPAYIREENTKKTNLDYREEVREIQTHKKRYNQLKFFVIWKGYEQLGPKWEHEEVIFKDHKRALAEYLGRIKKEHPKSFLSLMQKYKHLITVLKN